MSTTPFACPECEREVPDQVLTCPRCGFPLVIPVGPVRAHSVVHPKAVRPVQQTGTRPTGIVRLGAVLSGKIVLTALRRAWRGIERMRSLRLP